MSWDFMKNLKILFRWKNNNMNYSSRNQVKKKYRDNKLKV